MRTWKGTQNMQVISLVEGALIGRLDDFQFDLESRRIYGWRVKGVGMFARAGGVAAEHLERIGRDVAFVQAESQVEWSSGRGRAVVEGRAWAGAWQGTQALTRQGRALGAVKDLVIDNAGSEVEAVILHGGLLLPLQGDRVRLGPAAVIAVNESVVLQLPSEDDDEREDWWRRQKEQRAGEAADK